MHTVLSIDIGGSKLMSAQGRIQTDSSGKLQWEILRKTHFSLPATCSDQMILEMIRKSLDELSQSGDWTFDFVGVNVPGLADVANGVWVYAPFSGIGDFPIARILSEQLNKPVSIANDVNACALAERYFGVCRDVDHFLWVTVSNGVGGGLVLNQEVFSGASGNAGEIGHFCVEETPELAIQCGCGNRGCTEAMAAGPGVTKRYEKMTGQSLSAFEISKRARQGDEQAIAVFEKTGYYLGKAIAAATNLINPGKVILGGGVSESFDLFYPELKKTFDRQVFRTANAGVIIEKTALGIDAALAGAAAIAYNDWNRA